MRDVTIEPAESMNELCAKLDPAMHFGGALVILEARTPGQSALRHPQIEEIVSCVHVPGQSASLLDRFRPYTLTSLSFRRTLSAGWGGSAGWAHGVGPLVWAGLRAGLTVLENLVGMRARKPENQAAINHGQEKPRNQATFCPQAAI